MSRTKYYSILIPVFLLLFYSINFSQPDSENRNLIEEHLRTSSSVSFLPFENSSGQDNTLKDETLPLNPTQYLLYSGSWPYGSSYSVAVDSINNIIYLGSGGAVLVLNGINPANPVLITDAIRTRGLVEDIFIDVPDHRLYLACGEGGYEIWNVQDPANPFLYSRNEIYYYDVETPVGHVQVTGDFAIFECAWGYIQSVNVSDPYNPYQVSFNGLVGNPAHNIHIDQYGYIHATGQHEYAILYLNASGQLYSAGGFPLYNSNAVFGGSQASYVGQENYLWIFYNGGHSSTNVGGLIHIEVRGTLAYIINNTGLHIWDVSNNDYPILLGNISTGIYPADLYVAGNYAYVSLYGHGLGIYDLSNPNSPVLVGEYDTFGATIDAELSGNYVFAAHGDEGMSVIDISDLNYPVLVGSIDLPGYTTDIDVNNNIAVACGIEGGISIVDISNPVNPALISTSGNFNGSVLETGNNLAFVGQIISTQSSFIRIFDISDVSNPVEINSMEFYQLIRNLVFRDGYLFVPAYDDGLFIYDMSDPLNPVLINTIYYPAAYDVFFKDNIMYLTSATWSSSNGGIHLFDITDLSSPVHLGSYGTPGFFPKDIEVKNEFAYATDGDEVWLFVIDNYTPVYIEQYTLPDLSSAILAKDQYIFCSNRDAGLYVIENNLITNPFNYQWTYQNSGITSEIWDVDFINTSKGFAGAQYGIMLKTTNGGDNWESLELGSYSDDFYSLDFGDELNGWAGTESGRVFNTTDGGDTWSEPGLPLSDAVMDIDFVSGSTGWFITREDHDLLKTTDGGATFINQNSGLTEPYRYFDLHFVDENTGFVGGALTPGFPWTYFVIKTTNGGSNWSLVYSTQDYHIGDVYFVNPDTGFIGTLFGEIIRTTDGGDNWQYTNLNNDIAISEFCFLDDQNGWFVGSDGALYSTTNTGDSWVENDLLISTYLRAIDFVDPENGWIVGNDGIILRRGAAVIPVELISFSATAYDRKVILKWSTETETNNSGFVLERSHYPDAEDGNWKAIGFIRGNGTTSNRHNYSFTDDENLSGKYTYRLKQIDYDGSYKYSQIVEVSVNLPVVFSLNQNYPNPFNPVTTIVYSIPQKEFVTLKVYDVLGNEIATLVNEQQLRGNYEVIFNGENTASGVYFYQLQAGRFNSVKKFILLK